MNQKSHILDVYLSRWKGERGGRVGLVDVVLLRLILHCRDLKLFSFEVFDLHGVTELDL
jgi:hypothetical protein